MVRSANFRPEHIAEAVNTGDLGGRLLSGSTSPAGAGYIPVFFSFNNNGSMVPGSYAEVWLLGPVRGDVISVPVEALTEQQGAFYVYTRAMMTPTSSTACRREAAMAGVWRFFPVSRKGTCSSPEELP